MQGSLPQGPRGAGHRDHPSFALLRSMHAKPSLPASISLPAELMICLATSTAP